MNVYKKYANTRLQIEVLQKALIKLGDSIIEEIKDDHTPTKNEYGTYSLIRRRNLELSPTATNKKLKIKMEIKKLSDPLNKKIREIEDEDITKGKGKNLETISIRFSRGGDKK